MKLLPPPEPEPAHRPGLANRKADRTKHNGKQIRPPPLSERNAKLARLLARAPSGIVFDEHIDQDGAAVFRHALQAGLRGIVSKRLTAPYRSGPSRDCLHARSSPWTWITCVRTACVSVSPVQARDCDERRPSGG